MPHMPALAREQATEKAAALLHFIKTSPFAQSCGHAAVLGTYYTIIGVEHAANTALLTVGPPYMVAWAKERLAQQESHPALRAGLQVAKQVAAVTMTGFYKIPFARAGVEVAEREYNLAKDIACDFAKEVAYAIPPVRWSINLFFKHASPADLAVIGFWIAYPAPGTGPTATACVAIKNAARVFKEYVEASRGMAPAQNRITAPQL